jgi:hypothetical protein
MAGNTRSENVPSQKENLACIVGAAPWGRMQPLIAAENAKKIWSGLTGSKQSKRLKRY